MLGFVVFLRRFRIAGFAFSQFEQWSNAAGNCRYRVPFRKSPNTDSKEFEMIRKIIAAMFVLSFSAGAVAAQTTCASFPNTLTNGQAADANQVMANFNSIRDCVNNMALLPAMTVQVFTASGTYTRTNANVKSVLVYAKGGGGSGGGSSVASPRGGGGGEGAESWKLLAGAAATGQAVTVAAGGAAVALNTAIEGNPGGTSSLGSLVTAPGGVGGTRGNFGGAGGIGGSGGTRDWSMPGAAGAFGSDSSGSIGINSTGGGKGGGAMSSAGVANSGGGGGGGTAAAASGPGASGIVVVMEMY